MRETSCALCIELGVDLALNRLSGPQRAQVLGHVEHCRRCKAYVLACAHVATRLRDLLPELEPPAGFDARVLNALLGSEAPANGRPRPMHTTVSPNLDPGGEEVYDQQ
jgi:hypothetical protein